MSDHGARLPTGGDDGTGALKIHLVAALSDTTTRSVDGLLGSKSVDTPYFCPSCDLPVLIYGIAVRPHSMQIVNRTMRNADNDRRLSAVHWFQLPCAHAYCLSCASRLTRCERCNAPVAQVESHFCSHGSVLYFTSDGRLYKSADERAAAGRAAQPPTKA